MSASPEIVRNVAALRERVGAWRREGLGIGLVPTMGALHDGHLSLVARARSECDRVIATIFVNPTQFAPHEDFAQYPRGEAADVAKLAEARCNLVFAPETAEMYRPDATTAVRVGGLSEGLCAITRPHFFQGVATVVTKLLLQALPDRAYFGEKDYQQLQVVTRLARDLDIPVRIVGVPTVREPDGLAMSSRNLYLSPEERKVAPALYRVLEAAARRAEAGAPVPEVEAEARESLLAAGFDKVDYLEIRDAVTLVPLERVGDRPARAIAAAYLGRTRLIDNVAVAAR
ncbi:MAG: pantoate--beta-alanine ligase [Alphaproteobacteria bacterium]